ncbi:MAG: thioredoxin family protein [Pseudomonadota bacterium]
MKLTRRNVISATLATPVLALPAWASGPIVYHFSPGVIEDALADGKTVVAAYHAFWCGVCRRQERVLDRLRTENDAYNQLYFVRVDWDEYRDLPVSLDRDVFERSTILVLKGDEEVERAFSATSVRRLTEILDTALAADRRS